MGRLVLGLAGALLVGCPATPPPATGPTPTGEVAGSDEPPRCPATVEESRWAVCARGHLQRASALAAMERCDDAWALLEASLEQVSDPSSPLRGEVLREVVAVAATECGALRRRWRGVAALHCESEALATPAGWTTCGRLAEAEGEPALAMQRYERALASAPNDVRPLRPAAELALRYRDFATATPLYEAWARLAPDRAAWRGLAFARRGSGDLPGAIAALREAMAIDASTADLRFHLALWLHELGETESARAQLRVFLADTAGDPDLATARDEARTTLERWRRD